MSANEFKIQKASRRGVIPLIGLYAESGCGKTMSALLLARGLVGPFGDIHMIDTESRRGSLYADVIPGGFSVLDLEPPFTPARYIQAIEAIYAAGAKVVVIDSMSHEWDLGVLDMAAENENKSGRAGLHNWKQPKFEHAKLVQFLLRSPIPVVCCIRAKHKTKQRKDERGKTVIVKDDFASPIQADDFIFEMTAHAEVLQDHSIHLTKCSHPDLRKCFPERGPIEIKHGEMVAKWCAAAGVSAPTASTQSDPNKVKLWGLLQPVHRGNRNAAPDVEAFLKSANLIDPDATLSGLSAEKMQSLIAHIEKEGLNV